MARKLNKTESGTMVLPAPCVGDSDEARAADWYERYGKRLRAKLVPSQKGGLTD